MGNAGLPTQVPDPDISPFTIAPDDRVLVFGLRRDSNRRGIQMVNSFGAMAGLWHPFDVDLRDAVRLPTGKYLCLLRDNRSILLHHDGKLVGNPGQRFFTGAHGLTANLGGMGVLRSGQIIVADSNSRRLVLFDKEGKFVSHHPIAQAQIQQGRINGFFIAPNDDIFLLIMARGAYFIYRFIMQGNRAELVVLDPPLKGNISDFCYDAEGNLWTLSQYFYLRVYRANGKFISSFDAADPIFRLNKSSTRVWRMMRLDLASGRMIICDGIESIREIDTHALLRAAPLSKGTP